MKLGGEEAGKGIESVLVMKQLKEKAACARL